MKSLALYLGIALYALDLLGGELQGSRPNIILIITDDQGYGDLACHGNPHLSTPNLDRLHAQSVRFTDFHVSPTCAPTRSALLSGRHEFKNGVTHTIFERERLARETVTLPQHLKKSGYTSGIFGKWHLGDEDEYQPGRRGFDEVFIHGAGGIGQGYKGSCGDVPKNAYFNPVIRHNGTFVKTEGYCTDVFFAQARRWVERVKGTQPFYCHISTNAPHDPYICPLGTDARFAGKVPPPVARFYAMIENIDANVGRLLEALKEWGIAENTLVIFLTDNGSVAGWKTFNAGMRGGKVTPYLGGTRVPSFWHWPGTLKPGDVASFACHWDFFPTLSALAGAPIEGNLAAQVEGRSLLPLLKDPAAAWPERYFFTHVGRWETGTDVRNTPEKTKFGLASIRHGAFTLVQEVLPASGKPPKWSLYDLKQDFGQQTDVAAAHPERVKEMLAAYDAFWESVVPKLVNEDAPLPEMNPYKAAYWRQFKGPGPNQAPPPPGFKE